MHVNTCSHILNDWPGVLVTLLLELISTRTLLHTHTAEIAMCAIFLRIRNRITHDPQKAAHNVVKLERVFYAVTRIWLALSGIASHPPAAVVRHKTQRIDSSIYQIPPLSVQSNLERVQFDFLGPHDYTVTHTYTDAHIARTRDLCLVARLQLQSIWHARTPMCGAFRNRPIAASTFAHVCLCVFLRVPQQRGLSIFNALRCCSFCCGAGGGDVCVCLNVKCATL